MAYASSQSGQRQRTRGPIALIPPIEPPNLPGSVIACATVEEIVEELSRDLLAHSLNCVRSFGDFHMALSGGETPIPFYRHLMIDPICRGIPWRKTHLWLVDERCGDIDDECSNWSLISSYFSDHSGIPRSQQHPINAGSRTAAKEYEVELRKALEWRERGHDRLDFVLLGLDTSGAVASLFPNSSALKDHHRLVTKHSPTYTEHPARSRGFGVASQPALPIRDRHLDECITMTLRLINASRFVAILVTGRHKHDIIKELESIHRHFRSGPRGGYPTTASSKPAGANVFPIDESAIRDFPVRGVSPLSGTLRWYLDRDACGA